MDLRKVALVVVAVIAALIVWLTGGSEDPALQTQATEGALPTNGMVGSTVSEAAQNATTTVPVATETPPQN